MSDLHSSLYPLVKEARSNMYSDMGTSESEDPEIIEGHCHENAEELARVLLENGYEPIFVWGTLKDMSDTADIEKAEIEGGVHHWVELINTEQISKTEFLNYDDETDIKTGDTFVLDPYALGINKREVYCDTELPEDYRRLKGGFIWFEGYMNPCDFISINKYRQLSESNFVFEKAETKS